MAWQVLLYALLSCVVRCRVDQIGSYLADTHLCVKGFSHPGATRTYMWDPANSLRVRTFVASVPDDARKALASEVYDAYVSLHAACGAARRTLSMPDPSGCCLQSRATHRFLPGCPCSASRTRCCLLLRAYAALSSMCVCPHQPLHLAAPVVRSNARAGSTADTNLPHFSMQGDLNDANIVVNKGT